MKLSKADIIKILCEETDATDIGEASLLREDVGITSFQMLSFTTRLSEIYDISFKINEVMQWRTVGDILKAVEKINR